MKKTAVMLIRNWVRTNGNMSGDGKFIAYSCKKLEKVIAQVIEMEKKQIINACNQTEFEDIDGMDIHETITRGEQYYNETFLNK